MTRLGCILVLQMLGVAALGDVGATTQPSFSKVMLGPIMAIQANATTDAVSRGVRANLLVAINRRGDLTPVISDLVGENVLDYSGVARQGSASGCSYVVCGMCEQSGTQLRLLGTVIDCGSGRAVGSFKITGDSDDVFDLEDRFVGQVLEALPREKDRAKPAPAIAQANSGPMVDYSHPPPSPWDRQYIDNDAADSMNNLRYGNLDSLSGYGLYGYGGLYGGYGYFPSTNYNFVGYGPVWGTAYPVWGQNSQP